MIVFAVGALVALVGVGAFAASAPPSTHNGSFTLLASANYYTRYQIDVLTGGSVTVTFSVTSGGTVNMWVMTAAQHAAFLAGQGLTYLASDSGSSGTFSAMLPAGGTYFVETGHGSGYETQVETGVHTVTINAWSSGPFYGGIALFVVAGVLLAIGLYLRTRPETPRGYPPPSPYLPGQFAPYAAYPPGLAPPAPAWGASAAAPPIGTGGILVILENRGSADEGVQLFVNGAPAVSMTVPAGKTGQAHLRAPSAPPPGATVRVEAVTGSGARASQEVLLVTGGSVQVSLRIG